MSTQPAAEAATSASPSSFPGSSLRPRKTAHLSQLLDRRLAAYALAAGTAGVGTAALAQAALAQAALAQDALAQDVQHPWIQYTPANIAIDISGKGENTYPLDLNHDGIPDITIFGVLSGGDFGSASSYTGALGWSAAQSAGAIRRDLGKGQFIADQDTFSHGGTMLENQFRRSGNSLGKSSCKGLFKSGSGYLGVKFSIKGATHYGWVRFANVACTGSIAPGSIQGNITGYAYNTVPNEPIQAGQIRSGEGAPDEADRGSLGMLGLGALARH